MKAYLLLIVNAKTKRVVGAGVYSKDHTTITSDGTLQYASLAETVGPDYHEASRAAQGLLASPWFEWIGPMRGGRRVSFSSPADLLQGE